MECPNCQTVQEDAPECRACGVVISKAQSRRSEPEAPAPIGPAPASPDDGAAFARLVGIAVTCIATAIAFTLLTREAPEPAPPDDVVQTAASPRELTATEKARRATVRVKTEWGRGAGFLVNDRCQVVTSKQVVDPSREEERLAKRRDTLEQKRKRALANKKKYQDAVQHGPVSGKERAKKRLRDATSSYESAARSVEHWDREAQEIRGSRNDITVTMFDGKEYIATQSYLSSRRDLALLWLDTEECSYLEIAQHDGPPPLTFVHAVGVSGNHRRTVRGQLVESGKGRKPFLSLRGQFWGTKGGPLIAPAGEVIGMLTDPRGEGLTGDGFAIPADEIWTELGHHIERSWPPAKES